MRPQAVGFRTPEASWYLCLFLVAGGLLPWSPSTAQTEPPTESKYTIRLQTRSFTPEPGILPAFKTRLEQALARGETRHVYLQLERNLDKEARARLASQGIELLAHITSGTWYAAISDRRMLDFTSAEAVARAPMLEHVRWIGEVEPRDKIQAKILDEGVGAYNRTAEGTVDVVVIFFADVPAARVEAVAGRYGDVRRQPGMLNDVVLRLPEEAIVELAAQDEVQRIEEVGPPDVDHNDGAAAAAAVGPLWTAPYDLTGANVQVGQWESGNPDTSHDDLLGRVTVVEAVSTTDHATHVAGTVGGDGSLDAAMRGMADQVDFFSYSTSGDDLEAEDHDGAINDADKQIDLSTNSWGSSGNGYASRSRKFDAVVRGIYGRKIPIVFSASNSNHVYNSVTQPGGTAKNTLVVGNVNSDDLSISIKSSWGPSDEGQTKPDVVAPGDQTGGDGGTISCVADLFLDVHDNSLIPDFGPGDAADGLDDYDYPYGVKTGTSMAAPVVSGILALMLQQYRLTFFGSDDVDDAPLPSTFKAVLCHTAQDLIDHPGGGADLVGPDYVYGYGLVDAHAAVDAVRDKRFREGVLLAEDDEDTYTVEVEAADTELRVTLAWDDEEGVAGEPDILQNDLDLLVIDPLGTTFYTPWELDPSSPADPATRDSFASEAAAAAGRDNLNVVEQVLVDDPDAGTWTIKVKATELPYPTQRYSLIFGEAEDQLAGQVDIVQVLDRSGSMGGLASDTSPDTKIEVLRSAADQFIQMMKPEVDNQLGLVQFNQDVVPFDDMFGTDLQPLTTAHVTELSDAVATVTHGGSTSIGDGLDEAHDQLVSSAVAGHDRVALLVTDGKENTSLWISDIEADLVSDQVTVYPLGLGYGSGINEAKLTDLAAATGGTFRITSDPLVFRKFFIEVLAGAVDWSVIVDPIDELAPGETAQVPVTVTADQTGATFTALWEGIDDAIELRLIPPAGPEIGPGDVGPGIRYHKAARYAFYQLGFPLPQPWASGWSGTWQMKVSRPAGTAGSVRYSLSAFAEGGAELEVGFDRLAHFTGDQVLVTARLTAAGNPLTGAQLRVSCDVPLVGAGNVLHDGKVKMADLRTAGDSANGGDPVSAVDRKLRLLNEQAGRNLLLRGAQGLDLFDDGHHGDGRRADGVYANHFTATTVPGSYTCRVMASNVPAPGGTTTREWSISWHNEVAIDPGYSVVEARLMAMGDGRHRYRLKVVPRDRFGNYLGPGRTVTVNVADADGKTRQVELANVNLDGTYTGEISVAADLIGARWQIDVEGRPFTTVSPPGLSRWFLSAHTGVAKPVASYANDYDPGESLALDLTYRFTPRLSLVGLLGYSAFASTGARVDDASWVHLSANLKSSFRAAHLRPYIKGGVGYYVPDQGSGKPGWNAGLGVDYEYNSRVTLELGVDYHSLFDEDVDFVTSQVGVVLRF